MTNIIFKRWVLSAVAGLSLGALSALGQSPAPIMTRNTDLRLPVQLDERAKLEISQVKLYVRGPSGRWECAQTGLPSQTVFDFKAPADGEYRFTFVTVDRRGQPTPANVDTVPPHRVVIVDATPPEVSAQVVTIRGERYLQCNVQDISPDLSSLRVVYKSPDGSTEPLIPAANDTPTMFRLPPAGAILGKFTVSAADRAGNRTTKEIDPSSPTAPTTAAKAPAIDRGKPDPTLFPADADPVPPPADRGLRGAEYKELPRPRGDIPPMQLPILPSRARSGLRRPAWHKIPDAPRKF